MNQFKREFLLNLPSDEVDAVNAICREYTAFKKSNINHPAVAAHSEHMECLAVVKAFSEHKGIGFNQNFPTPTANLAQNVQNIEGFFNTLSSNYGQRARERDASNHFEVKTDEYKNLFGGISFYEFSQDDYARIQVLISELRSMITASNLIAEDHKRRLLRRLEAMQNELHLKTSDIDRFWGFIGEAGIVSRKFGEDLKPITERVQELGKIIITVITATEGIHKLPEIAQFLHLR